MSAPSRYLADVRRQVGSGTDECIRWPGKIDKGGYGVARSSPAHRFVYESLIGPIPPSLQLDHLCRNRACVNPRHLEPVTAQENKLRSMTALSGIDAHRFCLNGHERETHTRISRNGARRCRPCAAAALARYRAKKRALAA